MFKDVDIKFVNKEITPFEGLSLFFKMLEKCGFEQELKECGLPEQGSNRGYKPWQLVYGLFAGVWCGACKFGHLDLVQVGLIRMDSGFFSGEILDYLEMKSLNYIVACRFTWPIKRELVSSQVWVEVTDGIEMAENTYQAQNWTKPRRIVMVRQEVEKRPKAAGKLVKQMRLFEDQSDYGKYRYSCFVTDLDFPMKVVYDSYRGRADSENRIKELKADFSVDSFVTHNFWATEACGNFIVMAYKFFSLFRHALVNSPKKSFLKTIRYEFVNTPAYFSKSKDKHVLYLARSLKTRSAFQGMWTALDYFNLPYKV